MGKNKDRLLTKSIPWADSILEQVINLPAAGGEDLQPTAEAQVVAVENLLKMVNRKVSESKNEGLYVWKKSARILKTYENPTFSFVTPRENAVWGITSTAFDPHKVDESFFDGFTFDQTNGSQTTTQQFVYMNGELFGTGGIFGSNYPRISYDPETAKFSSTHSLDASVRTLLNGKFVGQKIYLQNEFINYVLSDVKDAYPSNGEYEGYWYESIEAVPIGFDFGIVTPTADTSTISVKHTLGKKPSYVSLLAQYISTSAANNSFIALGVLPNYVMSCVNNSAQYVSMNYNSASEFAYNADALQINFVIPSSFNVKFKKGVRYVWFALP